MTVEVIGIDLADSSDQMTVVKARRSPDGLIKIVDSFVVHPIDPSDPDHVDAAEKVRGFLREHSDELGAALMQERLRRMIGQPPYRDAISVMREWKPQQVARVRPEHLTWNMPESDPLADVEEWARYMREHTGYRPSRIFMPVHQRNRIEHLIARSRLSKRSYRRWRGRRKEERRNAR